MGDHPPPPPTTSPNDALDRTSLTMLARVREDDPAAWERLVRLYGPVIHRWCVRGGLQPDDAADVVQELFGTLLRKLDDFRRDRPGDSFRAWLWAVTRNKIRDHFRRLQKQPQGAGGSEANERLAQLLADDASDPSTVAGPGEGGGALDVFRRGLELIEGEFEPTTWQAFWRVQVEEQSPADVAAALGLTPNAVYKAKARVLSRLREEFGDLLD
jgi:RNA polymerase sigma-70 factor (ECF subfamily)